jgi:hypothetical protein
LKTFDFEAQIFIEIGHAEVDKTQALRSRVLRSVFCCCCNVQFTAVKMAECVAGVHPAAVSLELRSDSGVMSHWKDYDQLAAFSFLSHETAAPFHRTSTDTIPVPMVPQVGEFRAGRVHQLNAHAVELPLQVSCSYMELYLHEACASVSSILLGENS